MECRYSELPLRPRTLKQPIRKTDNGDCEAIGEEQWELGPPDEWVERMVLQDRIG